MRAEPGSRFLICIRLTFFKFPFLLLSPLHSFSSFPFCLFLNPRPPFTAFNQKELAGKIREGRFRRIPYRYSDGLNDIITQMLNLKVMVARLCVHCLFQSLGKTLGLP